ncbi:hypothetical protein [Aureivirga sp. CE67]|uniref:hypothetical protein n=1 Tax=Aureivirga sp. CE67 TaxID=1788983 RepID=UPI0018C9BF14|nr:hypothetical protein [Aureivirga sp. CE67]
MKNTKHLKNCCHLLLGVILLSCAKENKFQNTTWKVKDYFHEAIYKIEENDDKINVRVIEYDDGTTKINNKNGQIKYKFKDLVKTKKDVLIDGTSGETKLTNQEKIKISFIHNDTLLVEELIFNKKNSELWVRLDSVK